MFIIRLCRARLLTHKPMCLIVAIGPGLCGRINVNAHRSFVNTSYRHALQPQFPPSRIELWNAPEFQLPSLHSVLIKAGARKPIATIATTINGHSATTQKEIFQSELSGVGFLFMYLSQAFEEGHFRKRELLFDMPPRRFVQNGNENTHGVIAQRGAPGYPRNQFGPRKLPPCSRRGFFWQLLARAGDVLFPML
jgi:hypothetical protein